MSSSVPALMYVTTVAQSLRFYRDQMIHMQANGYTVTAVSAPGADQRRIEDDTGITAHGVDMSRTISPWHDLGSVWRLMRTMREVRPDIVHAATPKGGLLAMIAATLTRRPGKIYHILGLPYLTANGRRRRLLHATERVSCRLADRVFCVSESIRDIAIQDGLCPPEKIVVIGSGSVNGVDALGAFSPLEHGDCARAALRQKLGLTPEQAVVGFVGRVVHDKGVDDLVMAWKRVIAVSPQARLVVVGDVEPHDPVSRETLAFLRHDPTVRMVGPVGHPAPYFSIFDVAVLPTWREGFGNVLIEAASMELPTVATTVPGCVDAVVDGVTGTLVEPGNPDMLGFAIQRYIHDPCLRHRHGAAGRSRVLTSFRREHIWDETRLEYAALLQKTLRTPAGIPQTKEASQ